MNRILLATTALIGLTALNPEVRAQMAVRVTGSVGFQAGYAETDRFGEGFDFQSESEIIITARGEADNGLVYGAKVEILTSANDPFNGFARLSDNPGNGDEVSLYVAGNWGKLEFGDFDGAADEMQIYAPTVGIGQVDGDYTDWAGLPSAFVKVLDSGDATKINYYSPRFYGLQFGAAYAPYVDHGENVILDDSFRQTDVVELGLTYGRRIGPAAIGLSGVYVHSDSTTPGLSDVSAWAVGAQATWRGFTIGGGYVDRGDSDRFDGADISGWSVGASYRTGRWSFAASYVRNDFDEANVAPDFILETYQAYGAGLTYALAPGLTLAADIVAYDATDIEDDYDDSGFVAVTEIKASF